ncbi:arsenate reductase [Sulfitobacter sp. SK012]|uniref:ArsC/Spx/MgsR family protein n=1 Tax=Sulfitobacter sp. SK012 TaxID=1389005 RepID=UPI000E0BF948|nr:ArsC/Spx/MgsR family protein [Sulfitobacter sp. SK012]AXI48945.1 arsenate reductase [Sulfitobacter sp. SK012]
MRVYGLKNCDTCRKAMKALPSATLVDVRAEGVPDAVLQDAYDRFGQALLNTRSTTWRGLSEDERAQPELTLLRQHPALMKRPLITLGDKMFLSWSSEVESDLKAAL